MDEAVSCELLYSLAPFITGLGRPFCQHWAVRDRYEWDRAEQRAHCVSAPTYCVVGFKV